jgi:hypothetical protein
MDTQRFFLKAAGISLAKVAGISLALVMAFALFAACDNGTSNGGTKPPTTDEEPKPSGDQNAATEADLRNFLGVENAGTQKPPVTVFINTPIALTRELFVDEGQHIVVGRNKADYTSSTSVLASQGDAVFAEGDSTAVFTLGAKLTLRKGATLTIVNGADVVVPALPVVNAEGVTTGYTTGLEVQKGARVGVGNSVYLTGAQTAESYTGSNLIIRDYAKVEFLDGSILAVRHRAKAVVAEAANSELLLDYGSKLAVVDGGVVEGVASPVFGFANNTENTFAIEVFNGANSVKIRDGSNGIKVYNALTEAIADTEYEALKPEVYKQAYAVMAPNPEKETAEPDKVAELLGQAVTTTLTYTGSDPLASVNVPGADKHLIIANSTNPNVGTGTINALTINEGTVTVAPGATLTIGSSLTLGKAGALVISRALTEAGEGGPLPAGKLVLGTSTVSGSGSIKNEGSVSTATANIADLNAILASVGGTIESTGAVIIPATPATGNTLTVPAGGTLKVSGSSFAINGILDLEAADSVVDFGTTKLTFGATTPTDGTATFPTIKNAGTIITGNGTTLKTILERTVDGASSIYQSSKIGGNIEVSEDVTITENTPSTNVEIGSGVTLTIASPKTLTFSSTSNTLTVNGTVNGNIVNIGALATLDVQKAVNGNITNSGTLSVNAAVTGGITNNIGATVTVSKPVTGNFINYSTATPVTVNEAINGTITNSGTITLGATGDLTGATLENSGDSAILALPNADMANKLPSAISGSGKFTTQNIATLGALLGKVNEGEIEAGTTSQNTAHAEIATGKTVAAGVSLVLTGSLSVSAPRTLTVEGEVKNGSGPVFFSNDGTITLNKDDHDTFVLLTGLPYTTAIGTVKLTKPITGVTAPLTLGQHLEIGAGGKIEFAPIVTPTEKRVGAFEAKPEANGELRNVTISNANEINALLLPKYIINYDDSEVASNLPTAEVGSITVYNNGQNAGAITTQNVYAGSLSLFLAAKGNITAEEIQVTNDVTAFSLVDKDASNLTTNLKIDMLDVTTNKKFEIESTGANGTIVFGSINATSDKTGTVLTKDATTLKNALAAANQGTIAVGTTAATVTINEPVEVKEGVTFLINDKGSSANAGWVTIGNGGTLTVNGELANAGTLAISTQGLLSFTGAGTISALNTTTTSSGTIILDKNLTSVGTVVPPLLTAALSFAATGGEYGNVVIKKPITVTTLATAGIALTATKQNLVIDEGGTLSFTAGLGFTGTGGKTLTINNGGALIFGEAVPKLPTSGTISIINNGTVKFSNADSLTNGGASTALETNVLEVVTTTDKGVIEFGTTGTHTLVLSVPEETEGKLTLAKGLTLKLPAAVTLSLTGTSSVFVDEGSVLDIQGKLQFAGVDPDEDGSQARVVLLPNGKLSVPQTFAVETPDEDSGSPAGTVAVVSAYAYNDQAGLGADYVPVKATTSGPPKWVLTKTAAGDATTVPSVGVVLGKFGFATIPGEAVGTLTTIASVGQPAQGELEAGDGTAIILAGTRSE